MDEKWVVNGRPAPGKTSRIAFGSCYDQGRASQIWEQVKNTNPDLFIWAGDIIYPDRPIPWPGNNLDKIQHKYALVKSSATYSDLIKTIPVIGIYDDHDFGANNGGKTYKWRKESQQYLLDFLDEPAHSSRRMREGAYTSYTLACNNSFIKIIILDLRYHREEPGP
ncbi:MAG: alkaline phosphatase D family protein, partial [Chitinophagales bacterium]